MHHVGDIEVEKVRKQLDDRIGDRLRDGSSDRQLTKTSVLPVFFIVLAFAGVLIRKQQFEVANVKLLQHR